MDERVKNQKDQGMKETIRYAELPLISVLEQREMDKARELMEELEAVKARREVEEEREEEIKVELGKIQREAELRGLRWGGWAFCQHDMPGRRTLDKEMLVAKGVGVEVIEACMKQGKGWVQRDFKPVK
mgnify:FL=1